VNVNTTSFTVKMEMPIKLSKDWCCVPQCKSDGMYRKHELVELCELAQELDLEKITSTNDYELSQVNRRTITENCVTQVVCEIGQVPIWKKK
jgi:hypothetical protein